jgi:hypothetical protein
MTKQHGMTIAAGVLAAIPAWFALDATAAAQGIPPIKMEFANGATLQVYGQINKGVLQYDDGEATRSYGLIDNDNSGTRFGLRYTQVRGDWTFENVNEFSYAPFSTSNANILDPSPDDYAWSNSNIRKLDFTFANDRYGKLWLGQGSMATDGILEIDLSATDVIAYSGVADSAAAQILRLSDGTLDPNGLEIGDVFANLDGDRRFRIRYDTPAFANITFAAAYGRNLLSDDSDTRDANLFDASLTYANTYNDAVEVEAGFGYNWKEGVSDGPDVNSWGGSASVLHQPSGLNFTFAAGTEDAGGGDNSNYWYTTLGLLRDFVAWGATAASVDYYQGADFALDEDAGIDSTDSTSWGLALVQTIDRANTELWLTYRSYDYADNASSFDDGSALFGGARFKF